MPTPGPVDLGVADPAAAFRTAVAEGREILLRTGGTSGPGSSVVRTTDSWRAAFGDVADRVGLGPGARQWAPGPPDSSMVAFARVHADQVGAATLAHPGEATHAVLTPARLARDLERLRAGTTVTVAGDGLSVALRLRAEAHGLRVHHYYGSTEQSFVAWGRDAADLRVMSGVEVDVREGALWVRSPGLFSRYDGPGGPAARDDDGFVTVGDRGVMDVDRLAVHGRAGAVTAAGRTVHLADVEATLGPAARGDVVALGVPRADVGEVVAVVLSDARDHAPLAELARRTLSPAGRPRMWLHAADLPRTDSGKVDRGALAASTDTMARLG